MFVYFCFYTAPTSKSLVTLQEMAPGASFVPKRHLCEKQTKCRMNNQSTGNFRFFLHIQTATESREQSEDWGVGGYGKCRTANKALNN